MRRLRKEPGERSTTIVSAAGALPFPPVTAADVENEWNAAGSVGVVGEFDLEIESSATTALTDGEIVSGVVAAKVIGDDDVDTVDFANNELDLAAHAYLLGDGPLQLTTSDTLPAGLALATNYWIIIVNSGTVQLATSRANALAGTAVSFSDAGTGTHTIEDTSDTKRISWSSYGLVGQASDGVIALTVAKGFTQRIKHRPRVIAYGFVGTPSAGNITVKIYPVIEV